MHQHPAESAIKKAGPMTAEEISEYFAENGYAPLGADTIEDTLSDESRFAQDPEGRWHLRNEA